MRLSNVNVKFNWSCPWVKQTHDKPLRNHCKIAAGHRAVSSLIGSRLRRSDVKTRYRLSTLRIRTTRGFSAVATATRTTTARPTATASAQSAANFRGVF